MTIYVVKYGDLVKVGYSSHLAARVGAIMYGIPGETAFIGHMPGDREVEAHLHERFASSRFSGEWFKLTEDMQRVFDALLIPEMPVAPRAERKSVDRTSAAAEAMRVKADLRRYAVSQWPDQTHGLRIRNLAERLGWARTRVRDFYHGDKRVNLKASEAEQLHSLALWIAPELASED